MTSPTPPTASGSGSAPFDSSGNAVGVTLTSLGPVYGSGSTENPATRSSKTAPVVTGLGRAYNPTIRTSVLPVSPVGGTLDVAVFAVAPTTGLLQPLPHYTDLTLSPIANAPGAATIAYPRTGLNFDLLHAIVTDDVDVEVEVWLRGMHAGSVRILLDEASGDQADPNSEWTFSGTFLEGRAAQAVLGVNESLYTKETVFGGATAGTMIRTIMLRCQARGELTDITYATFSNTLDSNNTAWQSVASPVFAPTDTLLDVLDSLVEAGMCDWEITPDHQLKLYNAGAKGRDLTEYDPPVTLWAGQSVIDGPHKHSMRESATHLLVEGSDGLYVEVSDATALARRGRRVTKVVSAGNIPDLASLTVYGQNQMQLLGRGKRELTHGLVFGADAPLPVTAFGVGDWIYSGSEYGIERLRVKQWVLSIRPGEQPAGSVTVNDLFADRALQLSQQIKALERGLTVVGTSTPTAENDVMPPARPTGLIADSDAYTDQQSGAKLALVSAAWSPVMTNDDGSAIGDLAGYVLRWRFSTAGLPDNWVDGPFVQTTVARVSTLPQNVQIELQVAARDWRGNQSDWSTPALVVTGSDDQPPPTPSTPSLADQLGIITIGWDGLGSVGEDMPSDFSHCEVHKSFSAAFTASDATRLPLQVRAASTVAYDPPPADMGVTHYVRLIAVDNSGNKSGQSDIASVTPSDLIDLTGLLVDAAHLADGAVTTPKIFPEAVITPHLSIAAFSNNLVPNGGFEDVALGDAGMPANWEAGSASGTTVTWSRTTADARSGSASARGQLGTASGFAELDATVPIPVRPGEVWVFDVMARADRAVTGGIRLVAEFGDTEVTNDGGFFMASASNLTTTWPSTPVQFQYTIPNTVDAGVVPRFMRPIIRVGAVSGDSAALTVWVDDVRARKVVGQADIANAAIGNAQIQNASIQNAKIADLDVGKITSGIGTFDMLMASGAMYSSTSGAGWLLDPAGFVLYDSGGDPTVELNADGSAYLSGTFQAGSGSDVIRIQPNTSTGRPEIFMNAVGAAATAAYLNAVPIGGVNLTGLNSGSSPATGSQTNAVQGTVKLSPTSVELFVNTAPGNSDNVNKRRGAYFFGTQAFAAMGVSYTTSEDIRSELACNGDGIFGRALGDIQIASGNASGVRDGGYLWMGRGDTGTTFFGKHTGGQDNYLTFGNGSVDLRGSSGTRLTFHAFDGSLILGADNGNYVELTSGTAKLVQNNVVVAGGSKSFIIDHPGGRDDAVDRYLVHACIEGPANGVLYRGQASITDGWATVQLPDYFESLVAEGDRQVLTQPVLDEDRPMMHAVAASPVRDGRFKIFCSGPDGTLVDWFVMATRRDIPALDVEPAKADTQVAGDGPYRYIVAEEAA